MTAHWLLPAVVAAATARGVRALPEPALPGWRRTNYRGREVSLSTGLGAVAGVGVAVLVSPAVGASGLRRPALAAVGAAVLAGGYDDLRAGAVESAADKGLHGHLTAVRAGRLSGGAVKVLVIGSGALVSALVMDAGEAHPSLARVTLRAGLIASSANLLNLLDLRPGRAGKLALVGAVAGVHGPGAGVAGAVLGAVASTLPDDLAEVGMLGDLGANALGAALGVRLAAAAPGWRLVAAVLIGGLTLASERLSFSQVIDSVPILSRLDQLGRARQ